MAEQNKKVGELFEKIEESRALLVELEAESERIRQAQQHEEIEHLEEHMEETDFHLDSLNAFKDNVISELKELIDKLKNIKS